MLIEYLKIDGSRRDSLQIPLVSYFLNYLLQKKEIIKTTVILLISREKNHTMVRKDH